MYKYYFVNLKVAPKLAAFRGAQEEMKKTEKTLAEAMARRQAVQDGIDALEMQLKTAEAKKDKLMKQQQLCEDRMQRAVKLVSGLAGERNRWVETVGDLKISLKNVVGDILMSAGLKLFNYYESGNEYLKMQCWLSLAKIEFNKKNNWCKVL